MARAPFAATFPRAGVFPEPGASGGARQQQALHLELGQAVVPALGPHRPHRAVVDPLLEGGVADAQAVGRCPDGEECAHDSIG